MILLLYFWVELDLIHGLRDGRHQRLAAWIGITLPIWTLDGSFQFFLGSNLAGMTMPENGRVLGFFEDNMNLGSMAKAHPVVGVGPHAFDPAYTHFAQRADDPFINPA